MDSFKNIIFLILIDIQSIISSCFNSFYYKNGVEPMSNLLQIIRSKGY